MDRDVDVTVAILTRKQPTPADVLVLGEVPLVGNVAPPGTVLVAETRRNNVLRNRGCQRSKVLIPHLALCVAIPHPKGELLRQLVLCTKAKDPLIPPLQWN